MSTKPASADAGEAGFAARLDRASLFDLIQLECASRERKVVRVTSEGRSALVYFADGRIVHAAAGRLTGEAAIHELLTWGRGTFERYQGPWPRFETIDASAQSVLLRAAQALDEGAGKVVSLPVRELAPTASPARLVDGEVARAVRLSSEGEVLGCDGDDDEAGIADAVAYATQLIDRVGDLLGLDPFSRVELTFRQSQCLISRQPDGTLVALQSRPRGSLASLRHALGLDPG